MSDIDIYLMAKKFKWIDNDTITFINNEGIEKIISIKDKKFRIID
jgi:hypothetical protein